VALGGGGYQWARVVPRAWTLYFAEMAGATLPDDLPKQWVAMAEQELGGPVPATLSEEPPGRSDPPVAGLIEEVLRGRG
jgi:acetoin utilization protein AcuC